MRLTIISDDGAVGVDGEFFSELDLSALDPAIHAIQWYGEHGEVEFKTRFENGVFVKPENQVITDVSPYQFAIDAWHAAIDAKINAAKSGGLPLTELGE